MNYSNFKYIVLIIIELFAFRVFALKKQNLPSPVSQETKNYVINCTIYDENIKLVKPFAGELCLFLSDGSFISTSPEKSLITRYSPIGEVIWQKEYFVHHSLVLSNDKKRVLFLSSKVRKDEICLARDDVFVVLDVQSGKALIEKSARDFHKEFFDLNNIEFPHSYMGVFLVKISPNWKNTNCEVTHFNAFSEIPENDLAQDFPALSAGNFIASTALTPYFFIFDKNMEKIVFYKSPLPKAWAQFHDAQVLSDGKILYYENDHLTSDGKKRAAAFKFDLRSGANQIVFPLDLESHKNIKTPDFVEYSVWAGSVQELQDGYLFGHSHHEKGGMIIFTDKGGKIMKKFSNPQINPNTQKPFDFQGVKQFDLSEFLKNNKM